MQRDVMWAGLETPSLEHLRLTTNRAGIFADGLIVGLWEGAPRRIRYEVRCDAAWRARSVLVTSLESEGPEVDLVSDRNGAWTTREGVAVPELDGCIDVDISATPFTNTLPIRRLRLVPEGPQEIRAVYVAIAGMRTWAEPQRYTVLEARGDGGLYRFESLDGGFEADLPVDADGVVLDYPGLFERVEPG